MVVMEKQLVEEKKGVKVWRPYDKEDCILLFTQNIEDAEKLHQMFESVQGEYKQEQYQLESDKIDYAPQFSSVKVTFSEDESYKIPILKRLIEESGNVVNEELIRKLIGMRILWNNGLNAKVYNSIRIDELNVSLLSDFLRMYTRIQKMFSEGNVDSEYDRVCDNNAYDEVCRLHSKFLEQYGEECNDMKTFKLLEVLMASHSRGEKKDPSVAIKAIGSMKKPKEEI
jgi:hypothetical protein